MLIFTSINLNYEICLLNVSLHCFSWVSKAFQSKQVSLLVLVCGFQGPFLGTPCLPWRYGEWLGAAGEQLCQHLPCALTNTACPGGEWCWAVSPSLAERPLHGQGSQGLLCALAELAMFKPWMCCMIACLRTGTLLWVPPCLPSALPESRWGLATASHIQCVSAQEMVVP